MQSSIVETTKLKQINKKNYWKKFENMESL